MTYSATATTDDVRTWDKRRSSTNHDFLKGELLPALAKWIGILAGEVEDSRFDTYIDALLLKWPAKARLFGELLRSYVAIASPAKVLHTPAFQGVDAEIRAALVRFVHSVWHDSNCIQQKIDRASEVLVRCQRHYTELRRVRQTADPTAPLGGLVSTFRDECHALSILMSQFPRGKHILKQ